MYSWLFVKVYRFLPNTVELTCPNPSSLRGFKLKIKFIVCLVNPASTVTERGSTYYSESDPQKLVKPIYTSFNSIFYWN